MGEVIMEMNDYIKKLINANHLLSEDILNNKSFTEEDLIKVRDRIGSLIEQLEFWMKQNNDKRFCYELKNHLNWLLENYS